MASDVPAVQSYPSSPKITINWRRPHPYPNYTTQEEQFVRWLDQQQVAFLYEQIELVKSEKKKSNRQRVLHKVVDFVFMENNIEEREASWSHTQHQQYQREHPFFIIELTDRKRPEPGRVDRRKYDPKRETRHLARQAELLCGIIYRDELERFVKVFQMIEKTSEPPVLNLKRAISVWNAYEWERDFLAFSSDQFFGIVSE